MSAREAIRVAAEKVERLRSDPSLGRDEALGLFDDAFAELGNAAAQASLLRNVHPSSEVRRSLCGPMRHFFFAARSRIPRAMMLSASIAAENAIAA